LGERNGTIPDAFTRCVRYFVQSQVEQHPLRSRFGEQLNFVVKCRRRAKRYTDAAAPKTVQKGIEAIIALVVNARVMAKLS
jgi:hypothetical protein